MQKRSLYFFFKSDEIVWRTMDAFFNDYIFYGEIGALQQFIEINGREQNNI